MSIYYNKNHSFL